MLWHKTCCMEAILSFPNREMINYSRVLLNFFTKHLPEASSESLTKASRMKFFL